ncbi:hydrogenase nickel incorporation protein HypB [Laceyella putida]|uniref:Hydrogenase nickel incorporation protein HypB n=1 Tax=Laceyella putida TaxID=110101 RepID=A0ABW2RPI5_9BACL
MKKQVYLQKSVLHGNQAWAEQNRKLFQKHSVLTVNLISSPGAGKTTLLERTIKDLKKYLRVGVIEGDVATTLDAEKIAAQGVKTVQINTHGACHLDAKMISKIVENIQLSELDLLVIENVGNLVCPAEFDLGENLRVALLSTAEGEDKVLKYPSVFERADVVILNKIDLLPYVAFNLKRFAQEIKKVNPNIPIFQLSAMNGEGMVQWITWLLNECEKQKQKTESD